jgi:hypothetical protein
MIITFLMISIWKPVLRACARDSIRFLGSFLPAGLSRGRRFCHFKPTRVK